MPVASTTAKKVLFAIFCCTLLMLFTAPAWAQEGDTCQTAGAPAVCGITITISGATGQLTAAIAPGAGGGKAYDGDEDQIIGIINNSSVTVGAIRLSAPPINGPPFTSNLFNFDGDGPACYAPFKLICPNPADPVDYQGPNNTFTGISLDYTTGTVRFVTPIPPNGSTWFALENAPAAVVSIGETQVLATGVPNVFPFGPFTCTSDGCGPGSGTWTEQTSTPAVDDFVLTPISALTGIDSWTVLPIPVPAGQLESASFGPFDIPSPTPSSSPVWFWNATGSFGAVTPTPPTFGPPAFFTNFPTANSIACSPYTDYSSAASGGSGSQPGSGTQPTCVELERSCIGPDCETVKWEAQFDYDQDSNSIPFLVGGPAALYVPEVPGPTSPGIPLPYTTSATDFTENAINSYTGATPTPEGTLPQDKPPTKASGGGGKSVFVAAFSPGVSQTPANQVPNGVTVGFPGFEVPTSNTSSPSCSKESAQYLEFPSGKQVTETVPAVNCLLALTTKKQQIPLPWLLVWDDTTTSSNTPVTNVKLCQTVGAGGACTTPPLGVATNWVHLSLVPVSGCGGFAGQDPLSGAFLNLNPFVPGQYTFLWEPVSNPAGCQVAPLLEFNNNGTITYASPAVFVYSF